MKYDFTSIIDRRGKDAFAIDGVGKNEWGMEPDAPKEGYDPIPMWVADMNFATCPDIVEAIKKRLEHPLFGYFSERDEYFDAIINWQQKYNGFVDLKKDYIGYENGVHGIVASAIKTLTHPGEKILFHTPYYIGFDFDLSSTGRIPVRSPLFLDQDNIWRMDFDDMETKIRDNNIHTVIFCSPHNPTGRVWEHWELERAMSLFEKYECFVISDEIWADIVYKGHKHIPTLMVNEWAKNHTISAYAPSKTFNLAGLVGSYHIIYNKYLQDRFTVTSYSSHYNSVNLLSMYALMGAYTKNGRDWTDQLLDVLLENCLYAYNFIKENFPDVQTSLPQGTYMMFLDLTKFCSKKNITLDEAIKSGWNVGVCWQDGRGFGGPCHTRINLASPKTRIEEAFDRLKKYVFI